MGNIILNIKTGDFVYADDGTLVPSVNELLAELGEYARDIEQLAKRGHRLSPMIEICSKEMQDAVLDLFEVGDDLQTHYKWDLSLVCKRMLKESEYTRPFVVRYQMKHGVDPLAKAKIFFVDDSKRQNTFRK